MVKSKITNNTLADLAERAASRKADMTLRHVPNENDLRITLEHAQLMAYPQYQAVSEEDKS